MDTWGRWWAKARPASSWTYSGRQLLGTKVRDQGPPLPVTQNGDFPYHVTQGHLGLLLPRDLGKQQLLACYAESRALTGPTCTPSQTFAGGTGVRPWAHWCWPVQVTAVI